jgi:SAM-dependent methyltransferase
VIARWRDRAWAKRARRARERQLDYMHRRAAKLAGQEQGVMTSMASRSQSVRDRLSRHRPIADEERVLEVGSGATGLIFEFGTRDAIGIDPLADHYAVLFPAWQRRAHILAAEGENLPFGDATFDVVMSDNVIDHAERPAQIVREMARVLRSGGILYLTVNIHHPIYHVSSRLYGGWKALGLPFEVQPMADHTVHLTAGAARRLVSSLKLKVVEESADLEESRRRVAETAPRHAGDRLKRLFYKNVNLQVIAIREPDAD